MDFLKFHFTIYRLKNNGKKGTLALTGVTAQQRRELHCILKKYNRKRMPL
jgi:hypothetical protein